jgi:hypothetical protein
MKFNRLAKSALAEVQLIELRLNALQFAMDGLQCDDRSGKEAQDAASRVRYALILQLMSAHEKLFAFTLFAHDDAVLKEAKARAYKRYLTCQETIGDLPELEQHEIREEAQRQIEEVKS